MTTAFLPKQGEISLQVDFAQPSFALFADVLQLGHVLWKSLAPKGMRLPDMKFDGGNTTYNEAHVQCFLFNYTAELNVRPDRIDIRTFDIAKGQETFSALEASTSAARERAPDLSFRSCTVITALHGQLESGNTRDFVRRYVQPAPETAGKQMSEGVIFFFEPDDAKLVSSVAFEPSLSIPGGLFVRTTTIWSLENQPIDTLMSLDEQNTAKLFGAFDIALTK